ncbi:MBL fold metallo-hydrolase [Consotaella aegiceratis]|uniref:MBL fold metallo-hydrolase n=1 Tax=Consotaella aegiceratis TaxID=3097961 RepID=UPI002F3EF415
MVYRFIALVLALLPAVPASAQMVPSTCYALADRLPQATFASFEPDRDAAPLRLAALQRDEVEITYVQHSTYLIESAGGVRIATDYAGVTIPGGLPTIVTMNKAHSSHYTNFPDPGIDYVLRGWNPEGGAAHHALTVDDVYVRNVPTDIRSFGGAMERDGNSIFVFEIAGLCIGHLGHLHHRLTDEDFAAIGRLDIVMVPVDGSMTLSQEGMGEIAERLRSSIILPMHRFAGPIQRFVDQLPDFAVEQLGSRSFTVSMRSLPDRPTVIILQGV